MHPPAPDDHTYAAGYSAADDPCVYPNGVLKNLLNIQNTGDLQKAEGEIASVRITELANNPIVGNFDLEHLKAIHRHIFQDIYAWAGTTRVVDIAKDSTEFIPYARISEEFAELHRELVAENLLKALSQTIFEERAAYYLARLNFIHPFREGNGRSQREYVQQIANGAGYILSWNVGRLTMRDACVAFIESGDLKPLTRIIRTGLLKIAHHPKVTLSPDSPTHS